MGRQRNHGGCAARSDVARRWQSAGQQGIKFCRGLALIGHCHALLEWIARGTTHTAQPQLLSAPQVSEVLSRRSVGTSKAVLWRCSHRQTIKGCKLSR